MKLLMLEVIDCSPLKNPPGVRSSATPAASLKAGMTYLVIMLNILKIPPKRKLRKECPVGSVYLTGLFLT